MRGGSQSTPDRCWAGPWSPTPSAGLAAPHPASPSPPRPVQQRQQRVPNRSLNCPAAKNVASLSAKNRRTRRTYPFRIPLKKAVLVKTTDPRVCGCSQKKQSQLSKTIYRPSRKNNRNNKFGRFVKGQGIPDTLYWYCIEIYIYIYICRYIRHSYSPLPLSMMQGADPSMDPNEAYKLTQSRILSLQETILDSSKNMISNHNEPLIQVDSSNILNYTKNKYKTVPKTVKWLKYDPYQCATDTLSTLKCDKINNNINNKNNFELILQDPPPFLPILNTQMINKLISVYIPYEIISLYLEQPTSNKRWINNEIWGSDVYTDDSDIILVLAHIGVFGSKPKVVKENGVVGEWDVIRHTDIIVNLLILDTLQAYQGSKRYGIRSRDWVGPQLHDGLSYAVYSIEFKSRDLQSESECVNTSSWV